MAGILLACFSLPGLAGEPAQATTPTHNFRNQDMSNLPSISQRHFGYLTDGTEVTQVSLRNSS